MEMNPSAICRAIIERMPVRRARCDVSVIDFVDASNVSVAEDVG